MTKRPNILRSFTRHFKNRTFRKSEGKKVEVKTEIYSRG